MKNLLPLLIVCVTMVGLPAVAGAQQPVITNVTANTSNISTFNKLELSVALTATYTNPYDYDEVVVNGQFTSPSGKLLAVEGFYMQDYTLNPGGSLSATGSGQFKIRFTPTETGTYTYTVSCTTAGGTGTYPVQNFQSVAAPNKGFIRKNASNYLSFDDGSQYIPIGENMGWQNSSVVNDYTNWLTKLADNGGNFIRVWMSSWAFALEWKNGSDNYQGLKKYKQTNAFYLDWLLDYCKQKDMYIMLALNNHGQVSTNVNPQWSDNPYNAANGGPATNTWDFFTNVTAKALHKNRLRYIVARYGFSQQIQSWELFNELHWTNQFETRKSDLTAWDNEMATFIKGKDVYNHLVTTSYGGTETETNTWNLGNIDFSQTHFYVNSPNIETVMSSANQSFLSAYQKPTLNGEFGLGPAGGTLSADDPNGVHVHNAIWGSMLSGGLGCGMTWWWDDYIEPRNLYYHYAPLSTFVSRINFVNDKYKKVTAAVTGGGGGDVTIGPGGGFSKAAEANFTIDAAGAINPAVSSLSSYLFGSVYNTQYRNPPTFTVNYTVAGQFKVVTASVAGTSPRVTIYLDGTQLLDVPATANTTYSISVPAGQHTIKADNLGVDWTQVSSFVFTNIGAPLSAYVLRAENNNKLAGYVLNNQYNWQYLKANNNVAPPAVASGQLTINGMVNGNYTAWFYSTATGQQISSGQVPVTNGSLVVTLPSVAWDVAFRVAENSTLPIKLGAFKGEVLNGKNRLLMDITDAENVQAVWLERGAKPASIQALTRLSAAWATIKGNHTYIDEKPLNGDNFYRLKIVDIDGRISFSPVLKLVNGKLSFAVQPNPFTNTITASLPAGKYTIRLVNTLGKTLLLQQAESNSDQLIKLSTNSLAKGTYYISVYNQQNDIIGSRQVVK